MSKSKVTKNTDKPINSNASGSLAGGIFQYQRALYNIFSAKHESTVIGVETLDDVSVVQKIDNGRQKAALEQNKNSLQISRQPFQDTSKNLWRTLHIWLSNLITLKQAYQEIEFCLVTNKRVPNATLVREMASARNGRELNSTIKKIRELATKSSNLKNKDLIAVSQYDEEDLKFVLANLSLSDADDIGSGNINLKEATIQLFQLDSFTIDYGDNIYQSLLGQLIDGCNHAWRSKKSAWFYPIKFRNRLQDEITRRAVDRYLDRPIMSTSFKNHMQGGSQDHLFLKQLVMLSVPTEHIDRQLESYWGYYAERIRLENSGVVLPSDWENREGELHSRWCNCRQNIEIEKIDSPDLNEDLCARKILRETLNSIYTANLGRHPTQHLYFTHGHYQALANDPDHPYFIYWHNQYKPHSIDKGPKG